MMFYVEQLWRDDNGDDISYEYVVRCDSEKAICEDCPHNMDCDEYDCEITTIRSPFEAFKRCLQHTNLTGLSPRGTVLDIFNEFKLNKALFIPDYPRMYLDMIDYDGFHDYIACDITLLPMPTKDLLFPYISHVDRIYKKDFDALEGMADKTADKTADMTAEMLANNYSIPKISVDK